MSHGFSPQGAAEAGFCEQAQFYEKNTFTFLNNKEYWHSVKEPGFLLDKKIYLELSQVYEKCNSLETEDKDFVLFEMHTIFPNGNLRPGVLGPTGASGRDVPCEKGGEQKELLQPELGS